LTQRPIRLYFIKNADLKIILFETRKEKEMEALRQRIQTLRSAILFAAVIGISLDENLFGDDNYFVPFQPKGEAVFIEKVEERLEMVEDNCRNIQIVARGGMDFFAMIAYQSLPVDRNLILDEMVDLLNRVCEKIKSSSALFSIEEILISNPRRLTWASDVVVDWVEFEEFGMNSIRLILRPFFFNETNTYFPIVPGLTGWKNFESSVFDELEAYDRKKGTGQSH
jgi:hypothetical protein